MKKTKLATIQNAVQQITQNQSINITKSVIKGLGVGDKININYSPIMIVSGAEEKNPLLEMEEIMWAIMESLPPPKVENLRKFAVRTCLKKIGSSKKTAEYLGFQRTYVSRLKSEFKLDPLFSEEPSGDKAIEATIVKEEEQI